MQCLTSPTREEVDAAHSRGKVLDIGIPSVQNLRAISTERRVLWAILALSALPLHFVFVSQPDPLIASTTETVFRYNSVLFLTTQANVYTVFSVDQSSISVVYNGSHVDNVYFGANWVLNDFLAAIHNSSAGMKLMRRLSASECLRVYSTQYMSSQGDLIVVQNENIFIATSDGQGIERESVPYVSEPSEYPSYQWQCQPTMHQTNEERLLTCEQPDLSTGTHWYPYGYLVQYCLSENVAERCEVNWNRPFAVIVAVSNLAKVICMFLTLWRHDVSAIMTVGDAIQSFLDRPNSCSQGFHIRLDGPVRLPKDRLDEIPVIHSLTHEAVTGATREEFVNNVNNPKVIQWRPQVQRWWSAASPGRWVLCLSLWVSLSSSSSLSLSLQARLC